jgi:hypothetical protein
MSSPGVPRRQPIAQTTVLVEANGNCDERLEEGTRMSTRPPSDAKSEDRIAVTVETVALTVAAIGLGLCLLATPGGLQAYGATTGESGMGARL